MDEICKQTHHVHSQYHRHNNSQNHIKNRWLLLPLSYKTITEENRTDLSAPLSSLSFHGFIEHELDCRVEDQHQGRQSAIPQSAHSLISNDLGEGIYVRHRQRGFQ